MQYPRFLNCKQSVWSVSSQFIGVTEAGVVSLLVVGACVVGAWDVDAVVVSIETDMLQNLQVKAQ